jgi:hypothetical protein
MNTTNGVLSDNRNSPQFDYTVIHRQRLFLKSIKEICDMYVPNIEAWNVHHKSNISCLRDNAKNNVNLFRCKHFLL